MKHTEQLPTGPRRKLRKGTLNVPDKDVKPGGSKCCGGGSAKDESNDDKKWWWAFVKDFSFEFLRCITGWNKSSSESAERCIIISIVYLIYAHHADDIRLF